MLSISNPDLTDKIYWCLLYDTLNFIWAHIHVLFMAMKTYFYDPSHEIQVWSVSKFHGNFMGHEIEWFMFHDPLNLTSLIPEFSWP